MKQILPERLEKLPEHVVHYGAHATFNQGHCTMEMVAWLAGEPQSDHPRCACPYLGSVMVSVNDHYKDTDSRTQAVLPLIPHLVGTRGSKELGTLRIKRLAEWLQNHALPQLIAAANLPSEEEHPTHYKQLLQERLKAIPFASNYNPNPHWAVIDALSSSLDVHLPHQTWSLVNLLRRDLVYHLTKEDQQALMEGLLRDFQETVKACCEMRDPEDETDPA